MGRRTPESQTHLSLINKSVSELVSSIAAATRDWHGTPESDVAPLNIRLRPVLEYRAIQLETYVSGNKTDWGLESVPYVSRETFPLDCAMILEEVSRQVVEMSESAELACDGIHRHPIGSWVGSVRTS